MTTPDPESLRAVLAPISSRHLWLSAYSAAFVRLYPTIDVGRCIEIANLALTTLDGAIRTRDPALPEWLQLPPQDPTTAQNTQVQACRSQEAPTSPRNHPATSGSTPSPVGARGRVTAVSPFVVLPMLEMTKTDKLSKANKTTGDMLTDGLARGAKTAVADEAAGLVLEVAKGVIGDSYPEFFKTAQGEDIAKIMTATALYHLAANNPAMFPGAEHIAAACGLVVEASARDLLQPKLASVKPLLANLATLGKGLAGGV